MKRVIYAENSDQLSRYQEEGFEEVILSPRSLSRFGRISLEECYSLAQMARSKGLRPFLEWDILMSETQLSRLKQTTLMSLQWQHFEAIRVQDKGAINYLSENSNLPPLHLILETGNHNLEGIKKILSPHAKRVERVVLSLELPRQRVLQAVRELPVQVEILGLGKILLYYSPRQLIGSSRQARAHSLEGPHRNLPVYSNDHGTFLFHSRDRFILHLAEELDKEGLDALRIDLRFGGNFALLPHIAQGTPEAIKTLRQHWPVPLSQGFFQHNKTDLLFKKLKNNALPSKDCGYIGEVLEYSKKSHVAILVKSSHNRLSLGESLTFHTPEGRTRQMTVNSLKDTTGRHREKIGLGEIGLIPPLSGLSVKTFVYRHSKKTMVLK